MSWSRPSRIRPASFLAVLGRFLIVLCLWNSPLPLLHAHPGETQDQATQFAEHLRNCHWRTDGQDCLCWHVHLVLWGQVQADYRESESPPPQPRPVEDHAVPSTESTVRNLAESAQVLSDEICCVSRILSEIDHNPIGISISNDICRFRVPIARMTVIRC